MYEPAISSFPRALSLELTRSTSQIFEGQSARHGHTCHRVGNRQMLTVGGQLYSNLSAQCDWESGGVAVYDLSNLTWGSVYNAKDAPYQVPAPVVAEIGGRYAQTTPPFFIP